MWYAIFITKVYDPITAWEWDTDVETASGAMAVLTGLRLSGIRGVLVQRIPMTQWERDNVGTERN